MTSGSGLRSSDLVAAGGRLVALMLAVLAITQPFWHYTLTVTTPGGSWGQAQSEYYGDRVTSATSFSSALKGDSKVVYYSDPTYSDRNVSSVMEVERWLALGLAALSGAALVVALAGAARASLRPLATVLDLITLVVSVLAPVYLASVIGQAANSDLSSSISGFQGVVTTDGGLVNQAWGPSVGWFFLLAASLAAVGAFALSFRSLKASKTFPPLP